MIWDMDYAPVWKKKGPVFILKQTGRVFHAYVENKLLSFLVFQQKSISTKHEQTTKYLLKALKVTPKYMQFHNRWYDTFNLLNGFAN